MLQIKCKYLKYEDKNLSLVYYIGVSFLLMVCPTTCDNNCITGLGSIVALKGFGKITIMA